MAFFFGGSLALGCAAFLFLAGVGFPNLYEPLALPQNEDAAEELEKYSMRAGHALTGSKALSKNESEKPAPIDEEADPKQESSAEESEEPAKEAIPSPESV